MSRRVAAQAAQSSFESERSATQPLHRSMSPDELRDVMHALRCYSERALSDRIGVAHSTVGTWLRGTVGVPRPVSMLLRLMAQEKAA